MSQFPPRHPEPGAIRHVCQQLLALGLILAALTPAANIVSLDVVTGGPGQPRRRRRCRPSSPAYVRESRQESLVPDGPLDAR